MGTAPQDPERPAANPVLLEYARPATGMGDRIVHTEGDDGFDYIIPPLSPPTWYVIRQIFVLLFLGTFFAITFAGNQGNLLACGVLCLMFGCAFWNVASGLFPLLRNKRKHVAISVHNASLRLDIRQDAETISHVWHPRSLRGVRLQLLRRGAGNYDCWEIIVEPTNGPELRIEFLVHNSFAPSLLHASLHEALDLAPDPRPRA